MKKEWLRRYLPAEILATLGSLIAAWITYSHTHSYVAAAGSGWVGEGIGFYGYFVTKELIKRAYKNSGHSFFKRISVAIAQASTNLFVEFAPAEVIDNFFIRPFLMFIIPQYIKPYALGFLIGKFGADIIFYAIAIIGYETKKKYINN